jgi:Tfp pilus assembly protein PilF
VPFHPKHTAIRGLGIVVAALLISLPAGQCAEGDQTQGEPYSLSDAVGDGLSKIRPLLEQKDYAASNKIVDDLITTAEQDSYDMDILLETRARILIQQTKYAEAIKPMEGALDIADRHHFNSAHQETDILNLLAQLYYQTAEDSKKPREEQLASYAKAVGYMQRYFKLNPKPNEDISFSYAQLLYAEAVAKNQEHPDPELITQARIQVEKVLLMTVHPKDTTYAFLLATLNQEQNYTRGAELIELMLSRNPSNKSYWADVVMFYMMLGQSTKDEAQIRKYNIRAINTIERAQALGFLKTPKDNFNLFTLYYNSNQFGTAADLLYAGLKAGTIDPTLTNWQLLASSYEQINKEFMAIEALKEAAKRFPANGELNFKIAQVYYSLGNNAEALEYSKIAIEKGGISKPLQTYEFIAYLAYEQHQYQFALETLDKAIELKKGSPDHQMSVLRSAIEDAIREEKEKEEKKTAQQTAAAEPTT